MGNFDILSAFNDASWLNEVTQKLDAKMRFALIKAKDKDFIPYSTKDGDWIKTDINWWTNGFWPASMWQMFLMTGEETYKDEAQRSEKMLDAALKNFKKLDHDVGFLWLISAGVSHALTEDGQSLDRALFAANMLAGRYNPSGFIRAWNGNGREGWSIIDTMMNLPLLYWASRKTGDPRYFNVAVSHADTALKYFLREDGSCNHIVIFDAETGEYLDNPGGQGYASGSSWSRGQAWALYGFTLSYILSGKPEYLSAAKRVANYFISQCADDRQPKCDFRQPAEPDVKDNAAGNIAASGLIELSRTLNENEGGAYFDAAVNILKAQEKHAANWKTNDPAIFTKCTAAYHEIPSRHMTMTYADYFFIEAVNKLRGEKLLFWNP